MDLFEKFYHYILAPIMAIVFATVLAGAAIVVFSEIYGALERRAVELPADTTNVSQDTDTAIDASQAVDASDTPTIGLPQSAVDLSQPTTADTATVSTVSQFDNFVELPTVTNESYWRLVRQGKAKPYSDLAEQYFDKDSDRIGSYDNLVDFPELSWQDIVNHSQPISPDTNSRFDYYAVHDIDAEPGTILSEITFPTGRIVVSVPELSGDLANFAADRGDSWIMIYEEHAEHTDAVLLFYQESTYFYVQYNPDRDHFTGYAGATLCSQVQWDFTSFSGDVEEDDVRIGRSSFMSHDGYRDPTTGEFSVYHDWGYDQFGVVCTTQESYAGATKHFANRDDVVVRYSADRATFTETTYTPSPAQVELLKELMLEIESRPLPDELLP